MSWSIRNSRRVALAAPALVVAAVVAAVVWAARSPLESGPVRTHVAATAESPVVAEIDAHLEAKWREAGVSPSAPADDLAVLRRLTLALHGTVPSLEEVRRFEADQAPDRLGRWTANLLDDPRFADYFAERLARSLVGVETGQFVVFRRDRFVDWLSEQLRARRPYDRMVRDAVASTGLWTGKPATNFVTAAFANDEFDEEKLTGRTVRAFLGQRIDCAQCHDHPFAPQWKQGHFEGLASYFGQAQLTVFGVEDKPDRSYVLEDRNTLEKRTIEPAVPFGAEWMPETGTRREKLAAWLLHPENRRFERAIANRLWGLMFGRPWHEPVDDLPDPATDGTRDLLDLVGADLRAHGFDIPRTLRLLAATRAFRLSSAHPAESDADFDAASSAWAVFPMTRLRPEQVIGSMLQSVSPKTIDQRSHLLVRFVRLIREKDFVENYGDAGGDEFVDRAGTIPQALLRMNGRLVRETIEPNPFSATSRIATFGGTDEACLEACWLACLSRRPTDEEVDFFRPWLSGIRGDARGAAIEDVYWALFNSWEFSWNH